MSDITPADALRELGDDQAEYAAAAAKKLGAPTWTGLFGAGGPDFDFDPDDTESNKRMAALEAEVERLHSWGGLLSLLDEHWPEDVFPDRTGKPDRDTGPRLVAAIRRAENAKAEVARRDKVLDEVRVAFLDCFAPDFGGWDWRDDDAVQTLARSLSRALASLNTSSAEESP